MRSGLGASWHSLLAPTIGHGGSAFGGSPPDVARHAALWQSLEHHASWLGLKFIRAEFEWRQFQPAPAEFTWESPEMRVLYRILSWAQRAGADVMLQCMWLGTPWLAHPAYAHDPALALVSSPADLEAFARGWVAMLRELRDRRGFSCIRWINLVNEPNYYWWLVPPDSPQAQDRIRQSQYLGRALQTVRDALARADLPVQIMGPDMTDLPILGDLRREPWFAFVDDVDFHSYCSCYDFEDPSAQPARGAYRMGERLSQTLVPYRAQTRAAGKGLFLTEAGTQTYGFKADDPAPGSFKASLKDTELLIRSLNLGIDGFNHWSYANRGDADGQWQFVDTWDRTWKVWLPEATPHRDAYYVLGLAIRHWPHRARILASELTGGEQDGLRRVWAAAGESPADRSRTILLVNDAEREWRLELDLPSAASDWSVLRSTRDRSPAQILRYETLDPKTQRLVLAPFSLTILTDSPLDPDQPGRF